MTVFIVTKDTCGDAKKLVKEADRLANNAYAMLTIFVALIDGIPKTLRSLKNGIQSLINLNKNVIRALRNNPAIRGPWKIVALMFAGLLSGVGAVLRGLKRLVMMLLSAMRGKALKKLQEKLKELRQKLLKYFPISNKVMSVIVFLESISKWLEPNEPIIDPEDKYLYPLVNNDQLKSMREKIRELTKILSEINDKIESIRKKVDEIDNFLNSVNPIIALSAAVANGINSVLGVFNRIFQAIKDLISDIPGIGWLLDKLDSLIDWALNKLGVKQLLQNIGASLSSLPFFSAVRDFLRDLEAQVNILLSYIEELKAKIDEKIKELEKTKREAAEALAIFLSQNVPKNLHEIFLPKAILDLINEAGGLHGPFRPQDNDRDEEGEEDEGDEEENGNQPEEEPGGNAEGNNNEPEDEEDKLEARYETFRENVQKIATLNAIAPNMPFSREYQPELEAAMNKLFFERPQEYNTNAGGSLAEHVSREAGRTLRNLKAVSAVYKKAIPQEFGKEYYEEGIRHLIQAQTDPVLIEALYGKEGAYETLGIFSEDRKPPVTIQPSYLEDEKYAVLDDVF